MNKVYVITLIITLVLPFILGYIVYFFQQKREVEPIINENSLSFEEGEPMEQVEKRLLYTMDYLFKDVEQKQIISKEDIQEAWSQLSDTVEEWVRPNLKLKN